MTKRCRLSCNEDSTCWEAEGTLYHLKLMCQAYLLPSFCAVSKTDL